MKTVVRSLRANAGNETADPRHLRQTRLVATRSDPEAPAIAEARAP